MEGNTRLATSMHSEVKPTSAGDRRFRAKRHSAVRSAQWLESALTWPLPMTRLRVSWRRLTITRTAKTAQSCTSKADSCSVRISNGSA